MSTAFEHPEEANAVADERESRNDVIMETGACMCLIHTDPVKEGLYEAKHQGIGFRPDAARAELDLRRQVLTHLPKSE